VPSPQFLNLPEERQQAILQASLAEFAEHGYDLASTNRIVQRAGISKGALFKYFRDKEALFTYVCSACLRRYFDTMPLEPADSLFDLVRRNTLHKMRFLRESPLTYQLMVRVTKEPRHPVYARVLLDQRAEAQRFAQLLRTLLRDELRPGLTWEHVMELMTWIVAGLQEKFMDSIPDVVDEGLEQAYEPMLAELHVFLEILKFGIYQEVPKR
jgi:AcrR family transcriptional regulator